jgi:hypothetical protein
MEKDCISLTDIARHKNLAHTDDLIRNWLRNRNTLEFLGIWERLNNPAFKPVEYDGFKQQAGLNSFTLTPIIDDGLSQQERLDRLNCVAIHQMTLLADVTPIKLIGGKE